MGHTDITNKSELKTILRVLQERDDTTEWEKGFLGSLDQFLQNKGYLTEGQRSVLGKIQSTYNAENIDKRDTWAESFTEEMKKNIVVMAHYYSYNPPYFEKMVYKILADDDFVPGEKTYRSLCENKYAKRVLETYYSEPLFPVGTMAAMRNTGRVPTPHQGKPVFVVSHGTWVRTSASGGRQITVLPIGSQETVVTEERWLKKLPKSSSQGQ
jgi:hypothetical protein